MNYYNPYLASWLEGEAGEVLAVESAQAVAVLTDQLEAIYATAGIAVADVATAFQSDDFTTIAPQPYENLPVNVANICQFTYMCEPDPLGPDIHANNAGYAVIAEAFLAVLS
jgi:hypothetical protein